MEAATRGTGPPRGAAPLRRALGTLHARVSFGLVIVVFCGASLAWSLVAALLHRWLPGRAGRALGRAVMGAGFRGGLRLMRATGHVELDLAALDALAAEGPMVIVCNHLSLLDAVLVASRVPGAICIAKASLWDNPALGGSVRLAGYIRNDAPLRLLRDAAAALSEGSKLLVFPEGTRSDGNGLGPFKPGFVLMARRASVPIQTVILRSNTPYLRRGWKLTRMPPLPLRYSARLGRRFEPQDDAASLSAEIRRHFEAELGRA